MKAGVAAVGLRKGERWGEIWEGLPTGPGVAEYGGEGEKGIKGDFQVSGFSYW